MYRSHVLLPVLLHDIRQHSLHDRHCGVRHDGYDTGRAGNASSLNEAGAPSQVNWQGRVYTAAEELGKPVCVRVQTCLSVFVFVFVCVCVCMSACL